MKKCKIRVSVEEQELLWKIKKSHGLVDGKMPKFEEFYLEAYIDK